MFILMKKHTYTYNMLGVFAELVPGTLEEFTSSLLRSEGRCIMLHIPGREQAVIQVNFLTIVRGQCISAVIWNCMRHTE
jgi:hypothetical protein